LRFGDVDDRRRLRTLLAAADVVIEGSRPRALEQLGIDASEMVRSGPQVWLSITGHGRLPPNDMRVGLGDDAAVAGGLVGWVPAATGAGPSGATAPVFVADAVADPMTGLTVAATAIDLLARGGRHLVDVALGRVAASVAPQPDDPAPASDCDPPRARLDQGRPLPLGRDTIAVLRELGIT
jgi:crotonobetainyl-CoA:carnitine CoA-transferase CaiB-like acyl-CoA transferase